MVTKATYAESMTDSELAYSVCTQHLSALLQGKLDVHHHSYVAEQSD
jgi:hypothetical protein